MHMCNFMSRLTPLSIGRTSAPPRIISKSTKHVGSWWWPTQCPLALLVAIDGCTKVMYSLNTLFAWLNILIQMCCSIFFLNFFDLWSQAKRWCPHSHTSLENYKSRNVGPVALSPTSKPHVCHLRIDKLRWSNKPCNGHQL
jgi:hypothetical protein